MTKELSVIVHGGAGHASTERDERKLPIIRQAVDAAWDRLCQGDPGEVAVAAALKVLESDQ